MADMPRPSETARSLVDWRSIENDREKYAAYLCSREWSLLKTAVHKRADGKCERCRLFPIDAVHHVTYERKYNEHLEDLAGWCGHCHAFTHGKSNFDPNCGEARRIAMYARRLKSTAQMPGLRPGPKFAVPIEIQGHLAPVEPHIVFLMNAIDSIHATPDCSCCDCIPLEAAYAAEAINTLLPFDYVGFQIHGCSNVPVQLYEFLLGIFQCEQAAFTAYHCPSGEDDNGT